MFFLIINPSVKYPYRSEIRSAGNISSQDQLKIFISSLLRQKKLPLYDDKYAVERATVWRGLEEIYRGCANFDRHSRLSLDRLRVVSNFGDGDCGAGKIHTRARESSRRRDAKGAPKIRSPSPKLETTRSLILRRSSDDPVQGKQEGIRRSGRCAPESKSSNSSATVRPPTCSTTEGQYR